MLGENIVLEVNGIGKTFKGYDDGTLQGVGSTVREVVSLNNISFQLKQGEILGIVGNNGAGKSTLLRIISGLLKPDKGSISYRGKLSSILDIGSGFHPDLSGIDNVYMVARLMGYTKKEIEEVLEDIFEFSELKQFKETPVKHYSSGMFMRLAFSLYTTLKSNLLIMDEVLSVGDMNFREKSSARIKEIAARGRTIILASHEMKTVQSLCTHGLLLEQGTSKGFDTIQSIIEKYVNSNNYIFLKSGVAARPNSENQKSGDLPLLPTQVQGSDEHNPVDTKIRLKGALVRSAGKAVTSEIYMDDEVEISFSYEKLLNIPVILSAVIADRFGNNIMSLSPYRIKREDDFVDITLEGNYTQTVKLPKGILNHGIFSVSFYVADTSRQKVRSFEKLLYFRVVRSDKLFKGVNYQENFSCPLLPVADWKTTMEF